jgi:hypothetical protein
LVGDARILAFEALEYRRLLAAAPISPPFTPAEIRGAYGIDSISDGTTADGSGQTVAIIDYGDDTFLSPTGSPGFDNSDLHKFDGAYNLPDPPSFTIVGENGGARPAAATDDTETSLDVEWVHAIAPGANIVLIETPPYGTATVNDIAAAVNEAAALHASVVSMSFGGLESSSDTSQSPTDFDDGLFTGAGISYVASTGDNGAPGGFPAFSPNVLAVGGTTLSINSNDTWNGETGWSNPTTPNYQVLPNSSPSGAYEVIDNSSPTGFSQSGPWTLNSSGGEDGNFLTAAGGTNSTATWSFNVSVPLPQGTSLGISLTWVPAPGNATNATYTVFDGGKQIESFTVDQTKPPNDNTGAAFDPTIPFQEVGGDTPMVGPLSVVLNASTANGTVCADAVTVSVVNNHGGSGGGISQYESAPAYQQGLVIHNGSTIISSNGMRTIPDVSMIGGTGVYIENEGSMGAIQGTSLSAPCWAGLVAIIDQGLAAEHVPPLSTSDPTNGLQALLYKLYDEDPNETGPNPDFHDDTSGFNGYYDGPGYDLVTGIGSPIANNLVPDICKLAAIPPSITPPATTAKVIEGGGVLKYATTPTISDPAQPLPVNDELRLSVTTGTLTVTDATIVAGGNGTSSVTVQGTLAQLDAALAELHYTSNGISGAVLRITPIDPTSGFEGALIEGSTATVTIKVNAPPQAQNLFTHTAINTPLTINLAGLVTSPTDPLDFTTFQITGQLGNGTVDASTLDTTGIVTYTPPTGFFGGDTFYYTVSSTAGLLSNVGTVWIVVGPTGSLSGYSYVDLNDNGIKDPNEVGIDGVSVTVQKTDGSFTFSQTVQTNQSGLYVLDNLPAGVYTITETEPAFFVHGKDTAGTPAPAASASGQFSGITLTGNATSTESGSEFNFGELGLRAQFILSYLTRRAFFASSVSTLTGFNASTGAIYVSYDAGIAGTLDATASAGGSGNVSMTLYNNNMQPLLTTAASTTTAQLTYQGTVGQPYFLEVAGTSPNASLQTSIVNVVLHNNANPLDVLGDGTIIPLDALEVINLLNTLGSGPLAGKQVPAGIMPDVLGNGFLSPQDALEIIDYLNLNPTPQPSNVALDSSAPSPLAVTPAVTSAASSGAILPPDIASPLTATMDTDSAHSTGAAAPTIPPVAAVASSADSVETISSSTALQISPTQHSMAPPPPIAGVEYVASNAPAAAPAKPVLANTRRIDPAVVATASQRHWPSLGLPRID